MVLAETFRATPNPNINIRRKALVVVVFMNFSLVR
jgi:hypothetical protein